jgi:hypothetical protein
MKYLVIALLALVLGGLIGRMIWAEKPPPAPVDPVHIILTQVRTHAVIEHERQIAIWYRACPQVIGKTPQIFIAWPAKLVYQLELGDVQVSKRGTVITVSTAAIHPEEPSVPTDSVDYLSTTSIFTFANEQALVNHELSKASPIARYLTTYFMARDPSVTEDFSEELRSLVEHLAGALGVATSDIHVEIPKVEVPPSTWPKLPKLELCEGTYAEVNGLPFAKTDRQYTIPIGFRPPGRRHGGNTHKAEGAGPSAPAGDVPKATATILPAPNAAGVQTR